MTLLAPACELALSVARTVASDPDGGVVPRPLRPLLRFRDGRTSAAALATVRQVLDADDGFRSLVASEATEERVGRPAWLFLHRPEGWRAELDSAVAASQAQSVHDRERALERSSGRRVEQLERTVSDLRSRLDAARSESDRTGREIESERRSRHAATVTARDLERRLERSESAHRAAVDDLAAARRLAEDRLAAVRDLERRVAALERERTRWTEPVVGSVGRAGAALDAARAELDAVAELLRRPTSSAVGTAPGSDATGGGRGGAVPVRAPVRLERGAVDDTFEATDQLLRTPQVVVLVDGYNVSMEGWAHLDATAQRERLVGLLSTVSARTGAQVHVVFDGDDDGRRPNVSAPLAVRVHYSRADVEADDVLISMAADLPASRPVVVVSSDRRVRDGVRSAGANVISSSALLAWERR